MTSVTVTPSRNRQPTSRIEAKMKSLLGLLALLIPPVVAASTPAGTYTVTDLGQGGHTGGTLQKDGTLGGGGQLSYNNGKNVEHIFAGTWHNVDSKNVQMCFEAKVVKPVASAGQVNE